MKEGRGLKCPGCGAPLRWRGDLPVIECRYCKTHVATGTGQSTREAAQGRSDMSPKVMGIWLAVIGVLMLGGIVTAAVGAFGGAGSLGAGPRVAPTMLASLPMNATRAQLVKVVGGEGRERKRLVVWLKDSSFDELYLEWDDGHPEHVSGAVMNTTGARANPQAAQIVARLQKQLGRRFGPGSDGATYSHAGTSGFLHMTAKGASLSIRVRPEDDPLWKERMAALWKVMVSAVQGTEPAVDEATRRNLLGWGYPPGQVAAVDVRTTLSDSLTSIPKRFPGAKKSTSGGLTFSVLLDQRLFQDANLIWDNSADAKLGRVSMYYRDRSPASYAAARGCLLQALGPGTEKVDNAAAQTTRHEWSLAGLGGVTLTDHAAIVYVHDWFRGKGAPSQEDFARTIDALARCQLP